MKVVLDYWEKISSPSPGPKQLEKGAVFFLRWERSYKSWADVGGNWVKWLAALENVNYQSRKQLKNLLSMDGHPMAVGAWKWGDILSGRRNCVAVMFFKWQEEIVIAGFRDGPHGAVEERKTRVNLALCFITGRIARIEWVKEKVQESMRLWEPFIMGINQCNIGLAWGLTIWVPPISLLITCLISF